MDIPVSLRRWFLAHFVVDLLVGLPLLFAPAAFLGALHWPVIDPVSPRIVGAALLAVAVQSFIARNDGAEAYRTMLNFKLLWSWAAIAALVIAAAVGAPDAVWAFMAEFIAFSGVWFHYRVRLGQMEHADDLHEDHHESDAGLSALLTDPKLATGRQDKKPEPAGDPEKVRPSTSFDKLGAEDIAAFAAERDKKAAAEAAAREAAEVARAAAELAAWEASDPDAEGGAPASAQPAPATKTLQGRPRTRDEMDDELTGASGEPEETADRVAPDDIAAMLAANQGGGDDEASAPAAADDIAAMLAANQGGGDDETSAPAAAEEAAGADDIAAMLAANQGGGDEPSAGNAGAAVAEEDAGADDIAAMLVANQGGGDDESSAGAAASAGADEEAGADDIAAMLAANQGGGPADPESGDGPAVDIDVTVDEPTRPGAQASDFAHLAALSEEPAAAAPSAPAPADLPVPAPEEVNADEVANDDIAAMLAANRASEG